MKLTDRGLKLATRLCYTLYPKKRQKLINEGAKKFK